MIDLLAQGIPRVGDPIALFEPHVWRLVLTVFGAVMGTIVGSFVNVCIFRVPARLSIVTPRSYCYGCGTMIEGRDNVPILGYWMLGGCCRHCGVPYGWRYPAIEALTGLLFALVAWRLGWGGPSVSLFAGWMLVGFLVVATFTDLDHFIIPDGVSFGLAGAALAAVVIAGVEPGGLVAGYPLATIVIGWPFETVPILGAGGVLGAFASGLLGMVSVAGLLWGVGIIGKVAFGRDAMGLGDVKLMLGIGALLGPLHGLVAFFLACIVGAALSIGWIVSQWVAGRRSRPLRREFPDLYPNESTGAVTVEGDRYDPAQPPATLHEGLRLARVLPRPYPFNMLPFGPYLAIGSLVTYLWFVPIQQEANQVLSELDLRTSAAMTALTRP